MDAKSKCDNGDDDASDALEAILFFLETNCWKVNYGTPVQRAEHPRHGCVWLMDVDVDAMGPKPTNPRENRKRKQKVSCQDVAVSYISSYPEQQRHARCSGTVSNTNPLSWKSVQCNCGYLYEMLSACASVVWLMMTDKSNRCRICCRRRTGAAVEEVPVLRVVPVMNYEGHDETLTGSLGNCGKLDTFESIHLIMLGIIVVQS